MIFLLILSFLIDNWLKYYLPFLPSLFSYLYPQLFITTIVSFFLLEHQNKDKLKQIFIIILIYDLLFSRIHFLKLFFLFGTYKMILYVKNHISISLLPYLTLIVASLIGVIFFQYLVLLAIGFHTYSFSFLYSQIIHGLLLNVIYSMILYYFLGIKKRKP